MGRILGIDYGESRIGLALTDQEKMIAFPYEVVKNSSKKSIVEILRQLCIEKKVDALVIGLPLSLKGKDTIQTKKVRQFSKEVEILGIPVFYQDERLSSVIAKKSLIKEKIKTGHNKEKIDKRAATIILQQFLDSNK